MFIIDRDIDIFIGLMPIGPIILKGAVARLLDGEVAFYIHKAEVAFLARGTNLHEGYVSIVLDIKIIEFDSTQGASAAMGFQTDR